MLLSVYWLWLARSFSPGSSLPARLTAYFGNPEQVYMQGRSAWLASRILTNAQCDRLCRYSPSEGMEIFDYCMKKQIEVLTPDNRWYPKSLLDLPDYPPVLFMRGRADILSYPGSVSVVGTRNADSMGIKKTVEFAGELGAKGAVIVSGGARGIDTAAHTGALQAGAQTVLVMGCGIDYPYLPENAPLREKITGQGALISEFLPGTQPSRSTFPVRNRIIAALSLSTLVVEAAEKSGSLITAGDALRLGRTVYAIPSGVTGTPMRGTDAIIARGMVKSARSPQDIVCDTENELRQSLQLREEQKPWDGIYAVPLSDLPGYGAIAEKVRQRKISPEPIPEAVPKMTEKAKKTKQEKQKKTEMPETAEPVKKEPEKPAWMNEEESKIYEVLCAEKKITPDDLAEKSGLPIFKILRTVTKFECKGLAAAEFGTVRLK